MEQQSVVLEGKQAIILDDKFDENKLVITQFLSSKKGSKPSYKLAYKEGETNYQLAFSCNKVYQLFNYFPEVDQFGKGKPKEVDIRYLQLYKGDKSMTSIFQIMKKIENYINSKQDQFSKIICENTPIKENWPIKNYKFNPIIKGKGDINHIKVNLQTDDDDKKTITTTFTDNYSLKESYTKKVNGVKKTFQTIVPQELNVKNSIKLKKYLKKSQIISLVFTLGRIHVSPDNGQASICFYTSDVIINSDEISNKTVATVKSVNKAIGIKDDSDVEINDDEEASESPKQRNGQNKSQKNQKIQMSDAEEEEEVNSESPKNTKQKQQSKKQKTMNFNSDITQSSESEDEKQQSDKEDVATDYESEQEEEPVKPNKKTSKKAGKK